METKEQIPRVRGALDLSKAMNSFKREQIRKILELPDHRSFSAVRWYTPEEAKSIEATYIIAKLYKQESVLSVSMRLMNIAGFRKLTYPGRGRRKRSVCWHGPIRPLMTALMSKYNESQNRVT